MTEKPADDAPGPADAAAAPGTEAAAAPPPVPASDEARASRPARLRRDRRKLMAQREERLYHLGGLAFELFRRERLSEPAMVRRATEVAEIDAAVREIDDMLTGSGGRARRSAPPLPEPPAVCPACGTEHAADARFCPACGVRRDAPDAPDAQPTAVLPPAPGDGA